MSGGSRTRAPPANRLSPEWVADGSRPRRRSRLLWGAVTVMAVVVVGLVVYQVLISLPSTPPKVTIASVHWNVVQGHLASGQGWFGPSQFNYTGAEGFPMNISLGGTVTISWAFVNYDVQNHSILSVTTSAPFRIVATQPGLPAMAPAGFDDGAFFVTVQVPNVAGPVLPLYLNVTLE